MNGFGVKTERLEIRPWRESDRAGVERMTGDPEMMRYISFGKPWKSEQVEEFLARQTRFLAEVGYCVGALCHAGEDAVIGIAGLQPLGESGDTELAWWVWKDYWGRGYATEAARGLVEHAFHVIGLNRLVAIADLPNKASLRVMAKLGMRYEGRRNARALAARHPDVAVELYSLERDG